MATVFWMLKESSLLTIYKRVKQSYQAHKTTINDATFLRRLYEKPKRPKLAHKKILFHQDNAPVHTSAVSMAKVHELRYKTSPHLSYFPDSAASDFFLLIDQFYKFL